MKIANETHADNGWESMKAKQRKREAAIQKAFSEMAEFVHSHPAAVNKLESEIEGATGMIPVAVLRIEVDADAFASFQQERAAQ